MEFYLEAGPAVSERTSRRRAAKHFNISRDSIAKMPSCSTTLGYRRQSPIRWTYPKALVAKIGHWLDGDMKVPRKQCHAARRAFAGGSTHGGPHTPEAFMSDLDGL